MGLCFIDVQRFIEQKAGGVKVGEWMTDPPSPPKSLQIVSLLHNWSMPSGCTSKCWHLIYAECPDIQGKWRENENEMIWAPLLIHGLSPVLSSVSSPRPASFLCVSSSFSILSSPLPPFLPPARHPWVISVLSHSTAHGDTLIRLGRRARRHTHTHTHWSGPQVKFNRNGQTAFLCQADCRELMLI